MKETPIDVAEVWAYCLCCVGYALMLSEVARLRGLRWTASAGIA